MATEFSSARERQRASRAGAEPPANPPGETVPDSTSGPPARLGDLLERIGDALVALDARWRCTYANTQAAALFARQPRDLLGREIWGAFPDGAGAVLHGACETAMGAQTFVQFEHYYEAWGRWFEHRIHPSPDGVSIFFHEVTARKRAETAARENAALLEGQKQVLESIAGGEPLARTLDRLSRIIEAQCPGTLCSILLLEEDGAHLRHVAAPSLPERFTRAIDGGAVGPAAGSCGTAAFRRDTVIVEDIAVDPLWDGYRDLALAEGLRACWSTPIAEGQGRVLGTFALYTREPGPPDARQERHIGAATHTAAIAIAHDRTVEALRRNEEWLRVAVKAGRVGIWECHIPTERVVWNDELDDIFGWPARSELTLARVIAAIHPDDRERFERAYEALLAGESDLEVEFRIVRPDGSLRWLEAKAVLESDEARSPLRVRGVALDVTARRAVEGEMRRRDALLAEAQRIAQVGSYEWDIRRNVVFRSDELFRIFGLTEHDMPPTLEAYLERVHPEDRNRSRRIIENARRNLEPYDFEERIVRPDGSVRLLRSQGRWVVEQGEPVALLGVCQDITERRQAERQLQQSERLRERNEELRAFAYTVSHDLKAPLRGIAGYADELQRLHGAGLDERARFSLGRIQAAARGLDRLIDDLLDYSRLDVEMPTESTVDLAALVDGILREARPLVLEAGTELEVRLEAASIQGWERGLRQALTNLIDNAIKYSRRARPPRVRVASEAADGNVRISVSDNGIGFDMNQHDRIFGLFRRLVPEQDFEGTGAGLAIVKKLVDKMGGRVRAESSPGAGATFVIELPDAADRGLPGAPPAGRLTGR